MRNKCTKENPMPKDTPGQWEHEGAKCTGSNYDDTKEYWECINCGQKWNVYYED